MKKWIKTIFVIYAAVMLWMLFDRAGAAEGVPYWQQVEKNLNLVPFHTVSSYWDVLLRSAHYTQRWGAERYAYMARHAFVNLAGNVFLFVPLGMLIPVAWNKCRGFFKTMLCAAGMILAVELLQLFTLLGSCDIDDLILNLSGVAVGCGLYKLAVRKK